ncbi:nucleotidyltransferase family protein [Acidovorax sp. NCPPB 3859]|nr:MULTISPECIES: nucleotidyltransferase family protein [unclassified Acidovorax]MDA8448679.1 nucleotidyltransferase family protein [Acidovorax sp. GBBC 3297]MDA8458202.1 nucleotidyltransferase family protein [Acidovorax sp. GBBC 3333]MDA8463240.1 nucleotidyltransferase family protein [Acidovorax sp. GBBC 3332]MDA8468155.1 nucleotidyltransferase family protein [Acidovorax sp. GBBC 3299]WCM79763.1 nucleotidyltransferase family protein [Acidovorax sp. GBBC 712]
MQALARHRMALALPSASRLDALLPSKLSRALRERQRSMALRALQRTAALRDIADALRGAGIRFCVVKGQGYAALFGDPLRREASDIDVLVDPENMARALPPLQALGYQPDSAAAADLDRYGIRHHDLPLRHAATGVVVELHQRLANRRSQFRLEGTVLWERHVTTVRLGGTDVPTLAPPAAVAYAAFHGTKHHWHRAFWLVDMALALRSTTLDWDATLALARQLGVERSLAMAALLAEAALGVEVPAVLRRQTRLLNAARPAAEALLPHLDALGSDRGAELAARMGVVRYVRWLLSLQSGWRGRVRLIPVLLAPTDDDRAALALPRRLEWAYPVVRVLRLAARHLARRWRG